MEFTTTKYNRGCGLLVFFIISLVKAYAQAPLDSVENNQEQIKQIAYGVQPAWMVTSAVSSVEGSALQQSFTPNLANTLFGRLSGLTVRQGSGEPGLDSPVLNGRGINTFGPGRDPLILVDGFESTFEQLTPDEVESITFLKDASATAIYGMRGANGVLLVTTKRGTAGPLKVNFSTQQGFQRAMQLPDFLGSYDYARLYNEALLNDGEEALYTDSDLQAYKNGSDPVFHPDVNWYEEVLRKTSPISNYNLNLSGGNQSVRYYVMLNALASSGLLKKTADLSENSINSLYKRYNFRANVDISLSKRLSTSVLLGGTVEDKANPAARGTGSTFNLLAAIPPNAFPVYNPNGTYGGNALYTNPLGNILETGYYTSNGRTLQAAFSLTEQLDMITEGLSISGSVAFNSYFRSYSDKSRQYERASLSQNDLGEVVYETLGQKTSLSGNESQSDQWQNYVVQSFLKYNRSFGVHHLNAMFLYNTESYTVADNNQPFQHRGIGGRFTYAYDGKYIGEFSFGYNGSENFPNENRFGFFPAASLGWIVSKEKFLKGNNLLQFLKIRGSYGLAGNDNIGGQRFMFNQYYDWASSYYFGNANSGRSSIEEGAIANPRVTWEKEKKRNFGFEATVLKRLDVSLDIFRQNRYDILAVPNSSVPLFFGIKLPQLNVGRVDNKGFESRVRYNSDQGKSLKYFIAGNIWFARNKIDFNDENLQVNEYLYRTGQSIGQPFVLEAVGFFKDAADIDESPKQTFTTVQPGDLKYKDQNQDGRIDQNDYYPAGNSELPEFTFGMQTGFQYQNFDFNVFFQGVTNRSVYLSGNYFHAFQNNGKIASNALGRWTPETAGSATYPRLSASNNLNNYQPSTFWQEDGSFIKLRSLELGYTLPDNFKNVIRLNNARVFVNGTNLFSWDHIKYSDPENLTGYPAVRTLSLGARFQF